ncbi:hypothetical protein B0H99_104110 [Planomicrobium soli]|uniref:Uncharacterized protein n=1 Tax=Planomicrobium soli TaxID=1176648 RepID=A0A2P8H356_9BACL|nr:hypothetical protein B0H99_104110 [Planomicrobium soli]
MEMNFDKVLELGWEDLALGVAGSTALMLVLNFFTLM